MTTKNKKSPKNSTQDLDTETYLKSLDGKTEDELRTMVKIDLEEEKKTKIARTKDQGNYLMKGGIILAILMIIVWLL